MSDFSTRLDDVGRSTSEPSLRLGRLGAPSHDSSLKSLFSNLKDFLTERPVKVRPGTPTAFDIPRFGDDLGGNLKAFFQAGPRGTVSSGLLVDWNQEPSLWQNLRDWLAPRKLPPLKTTSQAIAVPEIWTKNTQFSRVQVISILVHVVVIAAIVIIPLLIPGLLQPKVTKASSPDLDDTTISPYLPKLAPAAVKAGGGGGASDVLPAAKGRAPKFSWTQISRPMVHPPENAQVTITPTVLGNPNIVLPNPNLPNWGDPLGKSSNDSMGAGHGSGVGDGKGAGVGPGEQYGTGGGPPTAGSGGFGFPACLYCPRADYSDEAMKVKVQGVVELTAIIAADGHVTDVHVMKGLGLGLDEKAMAAVRTWRFKPALGPDGKPATVRQIIEITFQLF